jgi:hypothetical protein
MELREPESPERQAPGPDSGDVDQIHTVFTFDGLEAIRLGHLLEQKVLANQFNPLPDYPIHRLIMQEIFVCGEQTAVPISTWTAAPVTTVDAGVPTEEPTVPVLSYSPTTGPTVTASPVTEAPSSAPYPSTSAPTTVTATTLCRAAYPQTLTWMKVGGKSVYTDTKEQCLQEVLKHCPQKNYFVHSSEKANSCPSDCAALTGSGRWDSKCGDCASCGCVSATSITTACPTSYNGNWLNNCGGSNAWACHRMGHTHTYAINFGR